jgi:imidazolonepropionase-like amidohydrolase
MFVARPIRHQAAGLDFLVGIRVWQAVPHGEVHHPLALVQIDAVRQDQERVRLRLENAGECAVEVLRYADRQRQQSDAQGRGSRACLLHRHRMKEIRWIEEDADMRLVPLRTAPEKRYRAIVEFHRGGAPMRRVHAIAIATTVTLGVVAALAAPAHGQATVTAFEGARLIVGDGRSPIENGTLVVDGARIVQAGAAADVRVPAGAARVSLAGKTVMPMVIDTHVHLSPTRELLTRDLRRRAYYGVSAALSLGTDNYDLLGMRAETIPGATRFLSAGRGITMPEPGRITVPHWITSEAEGRKAVQELAARQVDIVKIWVDTRDGKYQKLTPEFYGAIIDEAHKHGLRVTAHIFDLADAKGLIRAGLDAFAHGVRDKDIDDELIAMFKERPSLVLTPNLPDRGMKTDLTWLRAGLSDAELERLEAANTDRPQAQAFYGIQARNLAKLNAAGVRITLGTDGNRPWGAHDEMADMVNAGMTPIQVIVAATRNSAEFLRLADTGTLQAGKSADFIVLDANPLDDIANTRRIAAVYLRGAAVDRGQPVR